MFGTNQRALDVGSQQRLGGDVVRAARVTSEQAVFRGKGVINPRIVLIDPLDMPGIECVVQRGIDRQTGLVEVLLAR